MSSKVGTSYIESKQRPTDGNDDEAFGTRKKFKLSNDDDKEVKEDSNQDAKIDEISVNAQLAEKSDEVCDDDEADDNYDDNTENSNPEEDVDINDDDDDDDEKNKNENDTDTSSKDTDQNAEDDNDSHTDEDGDDGVERDEDDENMIRLLRRAAAAQGIPFDFLIRQAMMSGDGSIDDDDNEPVEYPFGKLPKSLDDIAEFIQSDKCRKIVVLAGAGMSVSAGIPDFRSADGLYATLNPDLLTADPAERESIRNDPTVALEHNMFLQNPLPLLELQREFILGTHEQKWKATIAHRFVELLHSKTSKLVRLYTQNIDGLEDQCVQLPRDKVIAVHGSMDRAQCERCQSDMNYDDFCRKVKEQIKDLSRQDSSAPDESTAITCPTCGYNAMKPSIVLFRSSLPREFFESVPNDVKDTDLLLIIGTSLRVAPANSLVWRVPKTCLRLLVNREEVGDHLGMFAYKNFDDDDDKDDQDESDDDNNSTNINHKKGRDFFASGECDNILLQLIDKLGWINELKPLLEHKLPESSASVLSEYLKQAADKVVHSG